MSKKTMMRIPLEDEINLALEVASDEPRGYIGASMVAAECPRAVWYDFLWATPASFPGRIIRRFDQGHDTEDRIIEYLRLAGYEVRNENPKARNSRKQFRAELYGGLLSGGVDGFVRGGMLGEQWHLLECKIVVSAKYHYDEDDTEYLRPLGNKHPLQHPTKAGNESNIEGSWWTLHKKGVKSWSQTHYGQLQAYMGLSHYAEVQQSWGIEEPLRAALYVAMNGDTAQIHAELVEFEPVWWEAIKRRAVGVARDRGDGPERKRDTPMFPPCAFCDHVDVCHRGEPMAVSCRTCKHAEVKLPGDRGYFGKRMQWLCTKHKHGCGDFTACDDYQTLLDEVSF